MSFIPWLVILVLTLFTALYVAAEFAAVGVRKSRIQQLAQEGHKLARLLLPILQDSVRLDRTIAASQIGITLTSLLIGAYGQATLGAAWAPSFARWGGLGAAAAQSTATVVVLLALTAFNVILGELVPKSLALQFPTQTALYTVLPMRWSVALLGWFIAFLNGSGHLILRLCGISHSGHGHIHSPDEIEMLIVESRDGGLLEPDESERLRSALQLAHRTAEELMVPRRFLAALDADTPVETAVRAALESPYTRLPVYRGTIDRVLGVLHTQDLAAHYAESGPAGPASLPSIEALLRPVVMVPATVPVERLIAVMRAQRTPLVLVGDEFGGVEGLVTLEDVLAELLGDVADEFKAASQPRPERLPDGSVRLPGLLRVDHAARWVGPVWLSDEAEAITVGGDVLARLGHMPRPGEHVVINGARVEVEAVDGNLIRSLRVTPSSYASGDARGAADEAGRGTRDVGRATEGGEERGGRRAATHG